MDINGINSGAQAQAAYEREETFLAERRADRNTQNQILVELQNQNRQLKADLAKSEKNNRKMLFWTIFGGCATLVSTTVAIVFGILHAR